MTKQEFIIVRSYKKLRSFISSKAKIFKYIRLRNFFPKLLVSYFLVIAVCICIMGLLSYSYVSKSIKELSIKSNDKLLKQFKSTVDSLILSNLNDLSNKILLDTSSTNPNISYYFSYNMENNIYDMVSILEYCNTLKTVNPMLYSVGIYFERNQLLISNEGVRSTKYDAMENQNDLLYYYNLLQESKDTLSWKVNHNFIEEYGSFGGNVASTDNIIHLIRKIPFISKTTNLGGAIFISIDEEVFYRLIKETAAQDLDQIVICDSNGSVISHSNRELLGQNIKALGFGNEITSSIDPFGSFILDIDGISSIVSFQTSDYNDWKYITVTPMEKYNSAAGFLIRIIITISLASIIIGALISLITASKFSKPLKKLVVFCITLNKNPRSKTGSEYNVIQSTIEHLTSNMREQEQKFIDVLPVLKENFFQSMLNDNFTYSQELENRLQILDLQFPYKYFCTLAITVKRPSLPDNILLNEYIKINITSALKKIFNSNSSVCFHCEKDGNIAVILNFDMEVKELYELLNSFDIFNEDESTTGLFISMGSVVDDIAQIPDSYNLAHTGLKYWYIYPGKQLILNNEIVANESNTIYIDMNLLDDFNSSLNSHELSATINSLGKVISSIQNENFNYAHVMYILLECISYVEKASDKSGVLNYNNFFADGSIAKEFSQIDNIFDFQDWLIEIITEMFENITCRHSNINGEMVQKAIDQIKKNISSPNLSLKAISSALYISPSHLSRIFKSEIGVTFIDFITNLKLDHCKDLLLNTSMKIDEIAAMMNYSTSHYFISRFKIKYSYTPKEYRRKFSDIKM